jgi:hypothetical protein
MLYTVPLVEQRVSVNSSYIEGIYNYGRANVYPQQMKEYMKASGVCSAAVDKYKDFIFGDGFLDNTLNDIVINRKGETLLDMLEKAAYQKSWINTYCFHINYNALLEVVEVRPIPVEFVRLGDPETENKGKVAVWNNWAGESPHPNESRNEIEYIDLFTSDLEEIEKQIEEAGGFLNWKGQIFYSNNEETYTYSLASFDSVRNDVITDAAFSNYRKKNVKSAFSASGIIKYNALTESEAERREIIQQIKGNQGDEEAGNVMVIFPTEGEIGSEDPIEFTPIQQNNIDNLYINQEKSVNSRIVGKYNQPRALHTFFDDSGIYNTDLLQTAYAYYNEQTKKQRTETSKVFKKIFANWHEESLRNRDFKIKPQRFDLGIEDKQEVKETVLPNELPPNEEPVGDGTEAQEKLRGSVGGVTGILEVVERYNTGVITEPAAITMLIELFGFDNETARRILGT